MRKSSIVGRNNALEWGSGVGIADRKNASTKKIGSGTKKTPTSGTAKKLQKIGIIADRILEIGVDDKIDLGDRIGGAILTESLEVLLSMGSGNDLGCGKIPVSKNSCAEGAKIPVPKNSAPEEILDR